MNKTCHKCKKKKPKTLFYGNKAMKDGLDCYCKECRKEASRISDRLYVKTEKGKAKKEAYRKSVSYKKSRDKYNKSEKGKLTTKQHQLKYYYNMTIEQHEKMYLKQNGCCAVCKKSIEYDKIHTDHDHKTNEVRGLLCVQCNTRLGWYEEQKENVELYLKG